jgi:hypothetical protein
MMGVQTLDWGYLVLLIHWDLERGEEIANVVSAWVGLRGSPAVLDES